MPRCSRPYWCAPRMRHDVISSARMLPAVHDLVPRICMVHACQSLGTLPDAEPSMTRPCCACCADVTTCFAMACARSVLSPCRPQRAFNLSDAQKRSLREGRSRLMTESGLAHRRRTELWRQLDCQMMGDDRRSMERLAGVRRIPRLTTLHSKEVRSGAGPDAGLMSLQSADCGPAWSCISTACQAEAVVPA